MSENIINLAFAGNPNCGKTTLFNAFTGANLKVANWPGVTVEKMEGIAKDREYTYKIVDLPGAYSLTSYTIEEKVTREYILSGDSDVIVNVVDASSLERNLYLTLQLIEMGKPVVLALNMMDIVKERGMEIDLHRLPEMLGIPVVPVSARKRTGLSVLLHACAHHKNKVAQGFEHHHTEGMHIHQHHNEYVMVYSDEIEDKIDAISERLLEKYPEIDNVRWHSIKILENDDEILAKYPIELKDIILKSYESDIINQKYNFIHEVIEEVLVNKAEKSVLTDKIDKILTHRILAIPAFLLIMGLVFFLTFTVGDWLKGYFEIVLDSFSTWTTYSLLKLGMGSVFISLIVDGVITGVGGILTFLPNIFILFLALAFLEDSGYMSRVAYVMDGIMGKLGLSGRAFIPMLLGFGCTVPAVMATRALENPKDRIKTILVLPFMSCSARLPIYVLFSHMFFGKYAMVAAYSMYLIGVLVAIICELIIAKISKNDEHERDLLIELPEYKTPNPRTIAIYVGEKIKDYLTKAGTTIFIASVILWVLLNFGISGYTQEISNSFAAQIGKLLSIILIPCGLGFWQIGVAIISGLAAKEVVVSSLSVLYGVSNISSKMGMSTLVNEFSKVGFNWVNGYSMMLFCLLYIPCVATIAVIKKETKSIKYTLLSVILQFSTAWIVSSLFYQIASLIVK